MILTSQRKRAAVWCLLLEEVRGCQPVSGPEVFRDGPMTSVGQTWEMTDLTKRLTTTLLTRLERWGRRRGI